MVTPQSPTLEEAIEEEAAIMWALGKVEMYPGSPMGKACAVLVRLARDGQRLRALESDGWAVVERVGESGAWNEGTETTYHPEREDAAQHATRGRDISLHPCYLGPAEADEPVAPSTEGGADARTEA